jgi:hypothetical protein
MDIEEFKKLRASFVESLKEQRAELVERVRVIDEELSGLGSKRRGRKPGVKNKTRRKTSATKPTGKRRGRPPKAASAAGE